MKTVIVTGGDAVSDQLFAAFAPGADLVIAADSGLDHAVAGRLSPTVLVGDLDSVSPKALDDFRSRSGEVIAHPTDKDDTDLALAIDVAVDRGATHISVLGGAGRRLSHVLGNCAAIANAAAHGIATEWHTDGTTVCVATPEMRATVTGAAGDIVSLLPFGGPAGGVRTTGLKWSLTGDTLAADATRGVSNELTHATASVAVASGLLLVLHERNADS